MDPDQDPGGPKTYDLQPLASTYNMEWAWKVRLVSLQGLVGLPALHRSLPVLSATVENCSLELHQL